MAKRRVYDDDDGRTIIDMSGIERPRLITPAKPEKPDSSDFEETAFRPWETANNDLTAKERRWCVLGALKASLLIALAFIVGLGIVIALMVLTW